MLSSLERIYFTQATAKLEGENVPESLKLAWAAHWAGDLKEATRYYQAVAWEDLDAKIRSLVRADATLLGVKLGQSFSNAREASGGTPHAASFVFAYAEFSWAFFREPDRIWSALRRMWWHSHFLPVTGLTRMVWFLIGHIMAIDGRKPGFYLARAMHRSVTRSLTRQDRLCAFSRNIVLATFAYTHIAAERLDVDLGSTIYFAEKYLPADPYYQTLFKVSALYGYAYGGDVARTEIYASHLLEHHKTGGLARYRPVAKIMSLLPMALRGYAYQVEAEFDRILLEHDDATTDKVVNSQFYRVSGVLALCLGRRAQAISLSEKASVLLSDTRRSFMMWRRFDVRFREIAGRVQAFNPFRDRLLLGPARVDFPPSLSQFFVILVQLVGEASTRGESWFEGEVTKKLAQHLDCDEIETIEDLRADLVEFPTIRLGSRYLVFKVQDTGRNHYFREVLAVLAPVLQTLLSMVHDQRRLRGYDRDLVLANFSSQFAHDIHSPLMALSVALGKDAPLAGDRLKIARTAAGRIREMVNQLQVKSKGKEPVKDSPEVSVTSVALSSWVGGIVEAAISEKLLEIGPSKPVSITFLDRARSFGKFVGVPATDLMRILSNLMNNAIEASSGEARINISIGTRGDEIFIQVRDKGRGIPTEILSRLGREKLSHGKASGSGLGLVSARQLLVQHGGELAIETVAGGGTCVTLRLPKGSAPSWFVGALDLAPQSHVVVLDNQPEAHEAWKRKFEALTSNGGGVNLVHLHRASELRNWLKNHDGRPVTFLIDYDLGEVESDGIGLIESLGIENNAILVTGRDIDSILARCKTPAIRVIPKATVDLVGVQLTAAATRH